MNTARWTVIGPAVILVLVQLAGGCGSASEARLDFELQPEEKIVTAGQDVTVTVKIKTKVDINSEVTLSARDLPPNATASFNPRVMPSTADTSTLTITLPESVPDGAYTITIAAAEQGHDTAERVEKLTVTHSAGSDFRLDVNPGDRTLAIGGERDTTFNLFVSSVRGFQGQVNLSIPSAPSSLIAVDGPTPSTVPVPQNGNSRMTVHLKQFPVGNQTVPVTITASSGGTTHTGVANVHIEGDTSPGFALYVAPGSSNIFLNIPVTFTVTAVTTGGHSGAVNLSVEGAPSGLSIINFNQQSLTLGPNPVSTTFQVYAASPTLAQDITLIVRGVSGNVSHSRTVFLHFNPG